MNKDNNTVNIFIPIELKAALKVFAEMRDTTLSELAPKIIEEYLINYANEAAVTAEYYIKEAIADKVFEDGLEGVEVSPRIAKKTLFDFLGAKVLLKYVGVKYVGNTFININIEDFISSNLESYKAWFK